MNTIKRELRVAFSPKAQPIWLRVGKWAILICVAWALHGTAYFWAWVVGLPLIGAAGHLVYRWKTNVWRKRWGGWSDLAAGKDE